jgi:hypothetical protein
VCSTCPDGNFHQNKKTRWWNFIKNKNKNKNVTAPAKKERKHGRIGLAHSRSVSKIAPSTTVRRRRLLV